MRSGGGLSRQGTSSVARLQMKWETPKLDLYDGVDQENFFSVLPDDFAAAGQPLIVMLGSDQPEAAQKITDLETKIFGDENVAVGARLFRAVRLKGDKITKSHAFWNTIGGKELPRVVIIDATGRKAGDLEGGDLSASSLFKVMKKAASKTYKTDLDKVVKSTRELLDEMDQIEAKQKLLLEQKKTAKGGKILQIAAEEESLAKALKNVQTRDAELLKKYGDDRKVTKG
ncbi:MAG: hypothetical protein EXS13_08320 [Planctomycetes bacterium]|nr:hypothetical protein [Planctomycetota bacterium]